MSKSRWSWCSKHAFYLLCTHVQKSIPTNLCAWIWVNANFGLWLTLNLCVHISACYSKGLPAFLPNVHGMWINEYEQDCLVCDKISVSCSLVWQSSPGLWVLLSAPISLPNTAPSPQSRHSLTVETSTFGFPILRDMPCLLPHSISIAVQTPPI